MADWKQITARIRRARTSKDPAGQLSNLYEKTRDAMVAFELAKYFETSGQNADAAKWYSAAAERFRRADWKSKAQESAVRLGGVPGEIPLETAMPTGGDFALTSPPVTTSELSLPFEKDAAALESMVAVSSEVQQAADTAAKRILCRRCGWKAPSPRPSRRAQPPQGWRRKRNCGGARAALFGSARATSWTARCVFNEPAEPMPPRVTHSRAMPSLPIESVGDPVGPASKGVMVIQGFRRGFSLLEMQFRRLLTCPPVRLNERTRHRLGPEYLS